MIYIKCHCDTFEYGILSLANSRLIETDQIFWSNISPIRPASMKMMIEAFISEKQLVDPKKRRRKSVPVLIWILSCASRLNPLSFSACMHSGNAPTLIHRNLRIYLYSLYVIEAQNGNRRTNKMQHIAKLFQNLTILFSTGVVITRLYF